MYTPAGCFGEVCRARYRKWTPSGNKTGQRWVVSPVAGSSWVRGVDVPPPAEPRNSGPLIEGANTITPREFHVPPRPVGASQISCTAPPIPGIFFSFPPAKKPRHWLSGDQKGKDASPVPASSCATGECEFKGRTQRLLFPSTD